MQLTVEDYTRIEKCYFPNKATKATRKQINYIQEIRKGKEEDLQNAIGIINQVNEKKIEMIHDQGFTMAMAAFVIKVLSGGH